MPRADPYFRARVNESEIGCIASFLAATHLRLLYGEPPYRNIGPCEYALPPHFSARRSTGFFCRARFACSWMEFAVKKLLILVAVVLGLTVGGAGPVTAVPGPVPPQPSNDLCGFTMNVDVTGKINFINLPGGGLLITSPGQKATLTNPDNGKSVSYVVTGVSRLTFLDDRVEVKSTGRNVLTIPEGDRKGVYLTVGNVNFAITTDLQNQVRPFEGPGQVVNICTLLS